MKLSDNIMNKMLIRQSGRCFYCGCKLILGTRYTGNVEIDHILPISKYKNGTKANLCLSCRDCNRKKSDHDILKFRNICKIYFPEKLEKDLFYFEIYCTA